ncbi:MAG: PLP-dependent aminotransferase family protein, partial [Candidatus Eremiobacteraeota bacterium]|nr:PLP-dependent aminotransferase family protein [Candidatus Eremiobacteraeota bacterium]
ALAAFVADGHFALHVRRASSHYRERRDALVGALERRLGGTVRVQGAATGLHVAARVDADDVALAAAAAAQGVVAPALSRYALDMHGPTGLVLGFAAGGPVAIARAVERLAQAFEPRHPPPSGNRTSTERRPGA